MRIYLLPAVFSGEARLELHAKEAHYLMHVLRLKEGAAFAGRDRQGQLWDLVMQHCGKESCIIACSLASGTALATTDTLPAYQGPLPELHLYQCFCKGKKMEQIVRQATELGAFRIIPVQSRHSVVDLSKKEADELDGKQSRLLAMVKEAVQQSGSPIVTTVERLMDFSDIAKDWNNRGLALFFHQGPKETQQSLTEVVSTYAREHGHQAPVAMVIGPEGGLSGDEVSLLVAAGFIQVLLKTNILRAETAAIYALASVQVLMVESLT